MTKPHPKTDCKSHDEARRLAGMAAAGLIEPWEYMHLLTPPRRRRVRKPSLSRMLATARRHGVGSVVTPNGYVLRPRARGRAERIRQPPRPMDGPPCACD